jgi:hypothetical protein
VRTADATRPGRLARLLPALDWLGHYRRDWLRGDLVAALTTWALVVPQAIAYAQTPSCHRRPVVRRLRRAARLCPVRQLAAADRQPYLGDGRGCWSCGSTRRCCFSTPSSSATGVRDLLRRSGLTEAVGETQVYRTLADAVPDARAALGR